MTSLMLTLVHADCARCGSTRETVLRGRELQPEAVCCDLEDLIRLDPREPYPEDDYAEPEPVQPEVQCYYCGDMTRSPFGSGKRVFCSKACWSGYAE